MLLARLRAWSKSKQIALASGVGLLLLGGLLWWRLGEPAYLRLVFESPGSGKCERHLNRAVLERSLALGTRFLLAHQKPEGNFDYEYDWRKKTLSEDDNEVRQAGALWGLTLLYLGTPQPELAAAIERGLEFFHAQSRAAKRARCTACVANTSRGSTTSASTRARHIS